MYLTLSTIFDEFCKHFDGKLKWGASETEWTEAIFNFFSELNKKQYAPLKVEKGYMDIDYLWRDVSSFPYQSIKLAVEHENNFVFDDFLKSEIQHLLDIKADDKIAITYPALGEEEELVNKVKERIKQYAIKLPHFENYLLIVGFTTRKGGKPAIRFKGYLFEKDGELKDTKDQTIFQRTLERV